MIDWRKVTELRDEIGEEDFAEVVDLFLTEIDEVIGQLCRRVPDEQLEECLHFLKGSALNFGFTAFAELCAIGERAARAGDFGGLEATAVIESYEQSKARFKSDLLVRLMA